MRERGFLIMNTKTYLLLDYETRSRIDLAAAGQHPYAKDASTEILCAGYKIIGSTDNKLLSYPAIYTDDASETKEFYYALKHADFVVAHNAPFEQAIYNHTMLKNTPMGEKLTYLPPQKFICTAASAAVMGLPRSLEKVAKAIALPFHKDTEGRRLMLKMCKPRKNITRRTEISDWVEWVLGDENLQRLYQYCKVDLDVEEALFSFTQSYEPWTARERYTWVLDQVINQRGFKVDFDFIVAARDLLMSNEKVLNKQLLEKTLYMVKTAKSTAALKKFIAMQGYEVPNVQKTTVAKLLHELREQAREGDRELIDVLTIREQLGLSSTSKYEAFYQRADRTDYRVRDNLIYHGAQTGRWAGTGVQPQNFPRGTVKVKENFFSDFKHIATVNETYVDPNKYVRETVLGTDENGDEVTQLVNDTPMDHADYARVFYPNLTPTLSSMLRGCIVAEKGKNLCVGDFSSIEARVLLWCAGDTEGLAEYATGMDAYCSMAATVYKKTYAEIYNDYMATGNSDERQVGKKVILACGYQMGLKKFTSTLHDDGIFLPESVIAAAHKAFRDKYPKVPELWRRAEAAAIKAVLNEGKAYSAGKCTYVVKRDFLTCVLPSGRRLWYYKPEVVSEKTPWGATQHKLYHWATNSKTKQWTYSSNYGGKLVENIVQAISRDCMTNSMIALESAGYDITLTVHDEVITETTKDLETFKKIMATPPAWGLDIPLKVGAWQSDRYRK